MRQAFLFLMLMALPVAAQVAVEPGARVRLIQPVPTEPRQSGAVVAIGADSIAVKFEHRWRSALPGDVFHLPAARLELLTATRRRTGIGMLLGAPILAIAGHQWGSFGFGYLCDGSPTSGFTCERDRSMVTGLTIAGGVLGVGVGAIVGHLIKSETWTPVVSVR